MRPRVLVVDDERLIRWSLRERLSERDYEVVEATTAAEALEAYPGADVVILDYCLPDRDGLTVLREMRARDPDVPVVMLTAHSTVERAVAAMRAGAFHYASKPFELDEVDNLVSRALETTRLRREVRALRARSGGAPDSVLVGDSPAMKEVKELVRRIARSPGSTVLVTGESGTGKDLVSRSIHALSDRAAGPFMNITCSALPESLLESELFGHERGAFTDAHQQKKGLLEEADGGTVFLDEIGEMSAAVQAKLLRFLEDKTLRRVGGTRDVSADVRIVAATNRDLRAEVASGRFRDDLFYRLAVLHVHLPPLRERPGDVRLLVALYVDRFNHEFHKKVERVSEAAMRKLEAHPWPGNVRELRNTIERAMLLTDRDVLDAGDLTMQGASVEGGTFQLPAQGVDLRALERELVVQALARTGGNQTRAARLLGMNRDQIRYRIAKFELRNDAP